MPDSLFIKSKQLIELSGDLTLQLALLYPFKKDGANGLTMGSKPILAAPIQSTPTRFSPPIKLWVSLGVRSTNMPNGPSAEI